MTFREQDSDHMYSAPTAREKRQLLALRERRNRESEGHFLAEGVRVVEDLLASDVVIRWALMSSTLEDGGRASALGAAMIKLGIPVREVEQHEFAKLADTKNPQGLLVVAETPRAELDQLAGASVILVLDAVQDPGNFGTLVRSAEALGAGGVIALPGTVDCWNAKVVRSAAGSVFRQPIVQSGWSEAEEWLRAHGFTILAADAGGEPLGRERGKSALVVGNEGAGISREVMAGVDMTVGIPLRGRAESLNVAAAAAILLYELTR
jgi:RNA methyltransferase, TrmH family